MVDRIEFDTDPTLAAGGGYDAEAFAERLAFARVKTHIAQNATNRAAAARNIVARTAGDAKSIARAAGLTRLRDADSQVPPTKFAAAP